MTSKKKAPVLAAPETMPALCSGCRAPVLWVRRPDGTWHRPLDSGSAEKRLVIDAGGNPVFIDTYAAHDCGDIAAGLRPLGGVIAPYKPTSPVDEVIGSENLPDPLEIACPDCAQPAGKVCRSAAGTARKVCWLRKVVALGVALDVEDFDLEITPIRAEWLGIADTAAAARKFESLRGAVLARKAFAQKNAQQKARRDELHERAIKRNPCPICGASRGTACWDLKAAQYGQRRHNTQPHADRVKLQTEKERGRR